jgi:hypothetical protein
VVGDQSGMGPGLTIEGFCPRALALGTPPWRALTVFVHRHVVWALGQGADVCKKESVILEGSGNPK